MHRFPTGRPALVVAPTLALRGSLVHPGSPSGLSIGHYPTLPCRRQCGVPPEHEREETGGRLLPDFYRFGSAITAIPPKTCDGMRPLAKGTR